MPAISHGCWDEGSGTIEDFLRWRALLARAAGIATETLPLGEVQRETPVLDYEALTLANVLGIWDKPPGDPLMILLAHSDEEGAIYWGHAMSLADRLEELLPAHAFASDHAPGSILQQAEAARTIQFVAGLRKAAEAMEDVTFDS